MKQCPICRADSLNCQHEEIAVSTVAVTDSETMELVQAVSLLDKVREYLRAHGVKA